MKIILIDSVCIAHKYRACPKPSHSTGSNIDATLTANTSSLGTIFSPASQISRKGFRAYIETLGNFITVRFLKAIRFITVTRTHSTTTLRISNVLLLPSIVESTQDQKSRQRSRRRTWILSDILRQTGILLTRGRLGTSLTASRQWRIGSLFFKSAISAAMSISLNNQKHLLARKLAPSLFKTSRPNQDTLWSVSFAAGSSRQRILEQDFAPEAVEHLSQERRRDAVSISYAELTVKPKKLLIS